MRVFLLTIIIFAFYLLLTCLIEGVVIGVGFRKRRYVKYSIACNCLTNPLFNLYLYLGVFGLGQFVPMMLDVSWTLLFVCGEIAVVLVESRIYYYILQKQPRTCFLMSLAANLCSAVVGLLVMKFEDVWFWGLTMVF